MPYIVVSKSAKGGSLSPVSLGPTPSVFLASSPRALRFLCVYNWAFFCASALHGFAAAPLQRRVLEAQMIAILLYTTII